MLNFFLSVVLSCVCIMFIVWYLLTFMYFVFVFMYFVYDCRLCVTVDGRSSGRRQPTSSAGRNVLGWGASPTVPGQVSPACVLPTQASHASTGPYNLDVTVCYLCSTDSCVMAVVGKVAWLANLWEWCYMFAIQIVWYAFYNVCLRLGI